MAVTFGGGVCLPQTATAQNVSDSCYAVLERAEEAYRTRDYQESITLASRCTNPKVSGEEVAIDAHRLLGLAFLRQGQTERARSAILNILTIDQEYLPDPVSDPPRYVRLVYTVRQRSEIATVEMGTAREVSFRRGASVFIKLGGGISDYTGDMPAQNTGHPFDFQEFLRGNGVPFLATAELGYQISSVAVVIGFQVGNYPVVGYSTGSGSVTDSDRYTHQLLGRYEFGDSRQTVSPYIDGGLSVTYGGSGSANLAVGPAIGGGLNIAVSRSASIFVESRFNFTSPDDAIDGTGAEGWGKGFDIVSQLVGVGVKVTFGLGSRRSESASYRVESGV